MSDKATTDLATMLLAQCRDANLKLATAESCTGGLIAAALTEIAGSSDVFDRGFVTYSNEAKMQMLDVSAASLDRFGAVSESVAKEMAYGALVNSMADVCVAVTGVAGPDGGTDDKPVGTVWIAVATQGQSPQAKCMNFGNLGRKKIRQETVKSALNMMFEWI